MGPGDILMVLGCVINWYRVLHEKRDTLGDAASFLRDLNAPLEYVSEGLPFSVL